MKLLTRVPFSVQPPKVYPEAGVAVTVMLVPQFTMPPPPVVPPAAGDDAVEIVAVQTVEKFATRFRFAPAVNV